MSRDVIHACDKRPCIYNGCNGEAVKMNWPLEARPLAEPFSTRVEIVMPVRGPFGGCPSGVWAHECFFNGEIQEYEIICQEALDYSGHSGQEQNVIN